MTQQKDPTAPQTLNDHLEEFQPLLDDINIPPDQRHEFLECLWSIMVQFASLGFGADTASQAIAAHLEQALQEGPDTASADLTKMFAASQAPHSTKDIEARRV